MSVAFRLVAGDRSLIMTRRMRPSLLTTLFVSAIVAGVFVGCGSDEANDDVNGSPSPTCEGFGCSESGPCTGLECAQVKCENGTSTTLSGVVRDPAGKVPIFNAIVYVPNEAVLPLLEGAACDRCDAKVSGKPIAITQTDTSGAFTLTNVPATANVPLVIQIGKWRRQITIANVPRCEVTPVDVGQTRLPRNKGEGDIPRIALATGAADPLQCLLKKIGIDDTEFGSAGSPARIHLYRGGGHDDEVASSKLVDGPSFASAETLWGTTAELSKYDVVLLACEGIENDTADHKPTASKQALYDYAKAGGRLFTTHYHHTFFSTSPDAAPKGIAIWADPEKVPPVTTPKPPATTPVFGEIVGTFPKALAMKEWLTKQNALQDGKLPMVDARHNVDDVNAGGLNWISVPNANLGNAPAVQYLSFNAPVGAADDQVCGRVVFSNLHVGAGTEGALSDDPSKPYPSSCQTHDLSPQQKALEFMLFDLSSCVQKDDAVVTRVK